MDWKTVRQQVDLVALVQQRVPLTRQGTRWIGRCPFHDDRGRPNLDVAPTKGIWRCWVCGVGGDVIDWVRLTENVSAVEAFRRLAGMPAMPPKAAGARPEPRADRATRHRAYTALCQAAVLTPEHAAALQARGLSAAQIRAAGYASLPAGSREALVHAMRAAAAETTGIPGLAWRQRRDGTRVWRLMGPPGLLIPVRDRQGRIQALQIRVDAGPSRYRWLTSATADRGWHGSSPGTPFHVAPGTDPADRTWVITEGPLKADVIAAQWGHPAIGIPGVSLWGRVSRVLPTWHPRDVLVAFDQDADPATRARVQAAADQLSAVLAAAGIRVYRATWPLDGPKGLDDAVVAGVPIRWHRWKEGLHAAHG